MTMTMRVERASRILERAAKYFTSHPHLLLYTSSNSPAAKKLLRGFLKWLPLYDSTELYSVSRLRNGLSGCNRSSLVVWTYINI